MATAHVSCMSAAATGAHVTSLVSPAILKPAILSTVRLPYPLTHSLFVSVTYILSFSMARTNYSKINNSKKVVAVSNRRNLLGRSQRPSLTYKEGGVTSTVTRSTSGNRSEADCLINATRTYFKKGGKLFICLSAQLEANLLFYRSQCR